MTRTVVTPEREGDLIGLALADLDAGQSFESTGELETVVVVLGGVVDVEADGKSLGSAGGRSSGLRRPGPRSLRAPRDGSPAQGHGTRAARHRDGAGRRRRAGARADHRAGGPAARRGGQGQLEPHASERSSAPSTPRGGSSWARRSTRPATGLPTRRTSTTARRRPRRSGSRRSTSSRSIRPKVSGSRSATTTPARRRSRFATATPPSSGAATTRSWRRPATRSTTCGSWPVTAAR